VKRWPGRFRVLWLAALLSAFAGAAYPQLLLTLSPSGSGTVALAAGFTTKLYSGATLSTNGVGPTTWTVNGALPPGLTLNSGQTSATITGTPTTAGTFVFVVSASDPQFDQTASQQYSITVAPLLFITTALTLPNATLGTLYNVGFRATGGTPPYTWFIPGQFGTAGPSASTAPPGLALGSGGQLTGIPSQLGTFTFFVQVNDSDKVNPQSDIRSFSLTVSPAPTIPSAGLLPGGTVGVPYQTTLTVKDGTPPFIWTITQGSLPQGVVLFASGVISGTPTQAGNFSFSALARDIWGASVAANYTLPISARLAITTLPPLPIGAVGSPYSLQFTAAGSPPFTWSVLGGAFPAGLSLNASTGLLSGTPTSAGSSNFTLQLTDSTKAAVSNAFILTIAPQLLITTQSLPDGAVGKAYPASQISASGGTPPYTFSTTGSFPAGLVLNSSTGAITGTPTQGGRNAFTAQVKDSAGVTVTRNLVINVTTIAFTTPSPLPAATVGTPYSQSISVTGAALPDTFTVDSGALPGGIALDATGTLSGTPTAAGTFQFVVRVTDASQSTATQVYQLTVAPPQLPAPTLTGVNATEPPAQQPTAAVQLAKPYPLDLTVTITLAFASAVGSVDDPAIQFSTGGRSVQVTIPAGTTASPNVTFSTGTVAGTITLTLGFQAGGQNVTPEPTPTTVVQLPAATPVITSVTATRNSSGLEVDVTGFSNTRDMTGATFTFQASSGTNLQSTQVTISTAGQLFGTWFSDPTSNQYGSRFTFAQQFTITGNMTGITGVSVTLTNKQGTSSAMSASVP